jgi:hypothetical protein
MAQRFTSWIRPQETRRRGGQYTPALWRMGLAATASLLTAGVLASLVYWWLRSSVAFADASNLEVVKTTITVTAFAGAVLAGVYAFRKQLLAEGDAHRADAAQLAQRYTAAAEQLGHESAAVRLAGVYATARLADDWEDQRQTCIDVLCAYLRLPYDPADPSKHREGDREVRRTTIRIIRDHLRPNSPVSWCGYNFSFEGAVFDVADLTGARITGGHLSFHGARLVGGSFSLVRAEFAGGDVWFTRTQFAGADASFRDARFTGANVHFDKAQFASGTVTFAGAVHQRGAVSFDGAIVSGCQVQWGPFAAAGASLGSSTDRARRARRGLPRLRPTRW